MLTVVCANTNMIWLFPNESKWSPVYIIRYILKTFNNEQRPWKRVRVGEYGSLENSTYVTNLLVDKFNISVETTCGDASYINVNNEQHSRSIHNIVRADLIDSNQYEN